MTFNFSPLLMSMHHHFLEPSGKHENSYTWDGKTRQKAINYGRGDECNDFSFLISSLSGLQLFNPHTTFLLLGKCCSKEEKTSIRKWKNLIWIWIPSSYSEATLARGDLLTSSLHKRFFTSFPTGIQAYWTSKSLPPSHLASSRH